MEFSSIVEMLEVLSQEFDGMVPLETGSSYLGSQAPGSLIKLRQNSMIEVLTDGQQQFSDPLTWQFILTQKGTQRAKNLARAIGLQVQLEVELDENSGAHTGNKITINMYDKGLMPVVDELYLNDQSQQLLTMKQEGRADEIRQLFDPVSDCLENSIFEAI